jgi:chaperonin GroES
MKETIFEPISDKLVCKPLEQDEVSSGGIILPELSEQKTLKARVVEVGKGFWAAPGLFIETTIKPGDRILYQRFAAQTLEHEGEEYHIIQERDVLTKLIDKK